MPDDTIAEVTEETIDEQVVADLPPDAAGDEVRQNVAPDEPDALADEPETFSREYVEQLRQENGKYRQRSQRADQYARRLHTELVRATGRLADSTDLPFHEEHLDDPAAHTAAIDDLLTRKPHLASRRPSGDIGQGASRPASSVDLTALLRQRAR